MEKQRLDKIVASTGQLVPTGGQAAGAPGAGPGRRKSGALLPEEKFDPEAVVHCGGWGAR